MIYILIAISLRAPPAQGLVHQSLAAPLRLPWPPPGDTFARRYFASLGRLGPGRGGRAAQAACGVAVAVRRGAGGVCSREGARGGGAGPHAASRLDVLKNDGRGARSPLSHHRLRGLLPPPWNCRRYRSRSTCGRSECRRTRLPRSCRTPCCAAARSPGCRRWRRFRWTRSRRPGRRR
eukprot:SAG31_NODE_808_length_11926_cov_13.255179_11_plen_178_part_00